MDYKYKRVILKLSGEVLAGKKGFGVDDDVVADVAGYVKKLTDAGIQVGVVIGAGNFWRGRSNKRMERTTADYMGMMGTVMNSLAMADALKFLGVKNHMLSAIPMTPLAESYNREKAVQYIEAGDVVIFSAGTGSPFFSTDTTAALRAAEMDAELILLAKRIDGVYDSDPMLNPDAKKYDTLSYSEILNKKLGVMDFTAITLCMDNHIPIAVFDLNIPENIMKACEGQNVGTIVSGE
ncbi:UMP kinase [Fusibacter bizertensis]|uniref:Uridylate kinase n=1 Tax=Fusibacter bizertensis TaxID=1488331 RepID=A0ABT6N849_9FIRM|nr:UMP kinase [Fusibacter bizertensis]MDH8676597.1 UMP kinase [Fusibacter bizertensis]